MSIRQTRNAVQSGLVTPGPSRKVERYKAGSDEGSSTSAEESGGEAWNSKNDGAVIKQNHFGEKRRRAGRCKGVKTGPVKIDKRIKKRVKSESIDIESKGETMEDVASREEEEEMNATEEKEDEGNQAELEDDVLEQEAKTTTRRSGRPTKNPIRFDEERYQPFGGIARPMDKAYITKALVKLEESRAPSSRREFSSDGSPDPIASFSDDHDLVIDHPVDPSETSEIPILTLSNPVSENATPGKPKMGRPRKSALKPKVPSGSRKKRGKVIIDETKNQIRTIKVISSTSSDIGRHPLRGPKRFGVRSRRTVPVMGVSPYTGKRAVQSYTYETSSDSTESEDEEEIDPAEFREWIRLKREQEKKNGAFLLSLAARISDVPTSSSIPPPPTPPHVVPATLPTISEMPTWTRPFSLTPNRPPPPINPDHPSNQEQERVWSMFVDTVCTEWERKEAPLLRQVKVFQPAGGQASPLIPGPSCGIVPSYPGTYSAPEATAEQDDRMRSRESQASPPESIPRPGLDFEKSCDRLAGLEIADRAVGMRLHIPEKRSTRF